MTGETVHRTTVVLGLAFTSLLSSQRRVVFPDDRLAEEFQRDVGVQTVIAEPGRFVLAQAVHKLRGEPQPEVRGDTELFRPLRLRREWPVEIEAAQRSADQWAERLRRFVIRRGLEAPHVILCNPFVGGLVDLPWARSVIYYACDDYALDEYKAPWEAVIEHAYSEIRRKHRAMASVAPAILARVGTDGPRAVIPNGVDRSAVLADVEPAPAIAALPGPIAVYVGALDGRIEPALLRAAALALEGGTVVLVGPEYNGLTREMAADLPNVHFAGKVEPAAVPAILAASDVALIPHETSAVTEAMSPLKAYEYLAAGLPLVATDLEPLRGLPADRVWLRTDPEAFRLAVRMAISTGRSSATARAQFAEANSWSARAGDLLAFCESAERSAG